MGILYHPHKKQVNRRGDNARYTTPISSIEY